jgi:hypothetical protein
LVQDDEGGGDNEEEDEEDENADEEAHSRSHGTKSRRSKKDQTGEGSKNMKKIEI